MSVETKDWFKSIKATWPILVAIIGTWLPTIMAAQRWADALDSKFAAIQSDLGSLHEGQKQAIEDRKALALSTYSLAGASETALRTAIENPGFRVPDPRDPAKVIVVSASARARDGAGG